MPLFVRNYDIHDIGNKHKSYYRAGLFMGKRKTGSTSRQRIRKKPLKLKTTRELYLELVEESERIAKRKAYLKKWREENQERNRARRKKWREENPEKYQEQNREQARKYRENHREQYNAYMRAHRAKKLENLKNNQE